METPTLEQAVRRARVLFESGFGCAQSVLMAIAESQGIESDIIPQIATGFCGGISRTCGLCGAVGGAIMGLGLINGTTSPTTDRSAHYAVVQQVIYAFEARYGSTNCRELTGCDLGTPEGRDRFAAEHMSARCLEFVETATHLALAAANGPEE